MTTALPFLLVFVAGSRSLGDLGQWLEKSRRYLWLILTISHIIHLYQIGLYYQLGQSCPLTVWAVTSPLWIIMVTFSGVDLINPQLFERIHQAETSITVRLFHEIGIWYVWLIFTVAFSLGTATKHLLFYNIPALVLFLAAAIINGITRWRRLGTA